MSYLQNFNYRIYGSKPENRLVFLHGLMGYGMNWRSVIRHFQNDYEVLTLDQRGHGDSFQPDEGYAPENYADDLNKILEELAWEKVHLVGHSMGGRNAIQFAHDFGHKLKSLCIVDIGPEFSREAISKIEAIFEKAQAPFASKQEAKDTIEAAFEPVLGAYLLANIVENEKGLWDWRFSKHGILESLYKGREQEKWQEWQKIKCKTLLMRGSLSEDLSPATYEKMLASNEKSTGVVIEGAGHWVHYEKKEAFCRELENFLNGI